MCWNCFENLFALIQLDSGQRASLYFYWSSIRLEPSCPTSLENRIDRFLISFEESKLSEVFSMKLVWTEELLLVNCRWAAVAVVES